MTSKERVLAALEGRIPDRVPYGEFAIDFDTVRKILGHETHLRAKAKSQIAFWEGRQEEVAVSYLKDHIELHERLELDIITFPMATWEIPSETDQAPPRKINGNTWEDKCGRVFKYSEATHDITCVKDPVNEAKKYSPEDFAKEPVPVPGDERSWKILDAVIQKFKQVHQKFGKKIIKHCCGNVNSLLDFFIEIGYDAYQSIQPTAAMDICSLKRKYGEKITLWGGVAVENLMEGSPKDVRWDVRRAMECAKPGGRFILGTSHSVAVGSKYENFMVMLDEDHKLCAY